MKIYGAGLAGLLAGCAFQNAEIYEAKTESEVGHKALLRFRSSAVGDSVGIPFRKVLVRKSIWSNGQHHTQPTILHANNYSQKVIGRLASRSIWDLGAVERYIAPDDFIPQLIDRCRSRIHWSSPAAHEDLWGDEPIISTMPIPVVAKLIGETDVPKFAFAPITVQRYHIPLCEVYQTVYFPDPDTKVYRVSITGDTIIAEYRGETDAFDIFKPFGLSPRMNWKAEQPIAQGFGKIVPVDEEWRQRFIYNLTLQRNIYSLGRFATWRNILLDDVLHDIDVLKRLMKSTPYEKSRIAAKGANS